MPNGASDSAYIALLHSIVLGKGKRLVMVDLRALAADLGLKAPRTLLATGNLIFQASKTSSSALESLLEPAFAQRFNRNVDIIVRPASAWQRLVQGNPFAKASLIRPQAVAVRVMRHPLSQEVAAAMAPQLAGAERMAVVDGDLWMDFAEGIARSKFASATVARRLGVGTWRNWNTVRKLGEIASAS